MQVSVENTSALGRRMTVTLENGPFDAKVRSKLNEAARAVRLPGFRPGKVPMREIDRRFGKGIREEVADDIMRQAFVEAIGDQALQPAGMPAFDHREDESDAFVFVASFDVLPEFELADLGGERIERPRAEVTEDDIDDMVERLREQRKRYEARDGRSAESGDQLLIDFVGTQDGEVFDGGTANDFSLTLGQGQLIPGFEEGLTGVTAGEVRSIDVTFPEDYQAKALAGKAARFEVTVKEVREAVLPELDAAFFAEFDLDEATPEDFRAQVRGNMERELASKVRNAVRDQVMSLLNDRHEIEVPETLIAAETEQLRGEQLSRFGGQIDPEQARQFMPDELFRDGAVRRVRLGLVVRALVVKHELSPDEGRVRSKLEELAQAYEQPEQFIAFHFQDPSRLEPVRNAVLEDMVIETLCEQLQVTDVDSTYAEVVQPAPAPVPEASGAEIEQDNEVSDAK